LGRYEVAAAPTGGDFVVAIAAVLVFADLGTDTMTAQLIAVDAAGIAGAAAAQPVG
jgi:hypothetical protein